MIPRSEVEIDSGHACFIDRGPRLMGRVSLTRPVNWKVHEPKEFNKYVLIAQTPPHLEPSELHISRAPGTVPSFRRWDWGVFGGFQTLHPGPQCSWGFKGPTSGPLGPQVPGSSGSSGTAALCVHWCLSFSPVKDMESQMLSTRSQTLHGLRRPSHPL